MTRGGGVHPIGQGPRPVWRRRRSAPPGRLRSPVGVRRRPVHAHPGQGQGVDRAVPVLVRPDSGDRAQPPGGHGPGRPAVGVARPGRRAARPDDALPAPRRPAGRARRARLPRRWRLEGVLRDGRRLRHPAATRPARGRPASGADLHPHRRRPTSATTGRSPSTRWSVAWRPPVGMPAPSPSRSARWHSACMTAARPAARRPGSSWPTRSWRWAWRGTGRWSSSTRR